MIPNGVSWDKWGLVLHKTETPSINFFDMPVLHRNKHYNFFDMPTLWNAHRNEHYIFLIFAHPLKHPQESALHFFLRAHPSKCPLERALHFSNCPALAVIKVPYNYTNIFLEQVFSLFLHVIFFFSGEISFAIFWERNWENFGFFFFLLV